MFKLSPCDKHLNHDSPNCVAIRHAAGTIATPPEVWAEICRLEREIARLQLRCDEVVDLSKRIS